MDTEEIVQDELLCVTDRFIWLTIYENGKRSTMLAKFIAETNYYYCDETIIFIVVCRLFSRLIRLRLKYQGSVIMSSS